MSVSAASSSSTVTTCYGTWSSVADVSSLRQVRYLQYITAVACLSACASGGHPRMRRHRSLLCRSAVRRLSRSRQRVRPCCPVQHVWNDPVSSYGGLPAADARFVVAGCGVCHSAASAFCCWLVYNSEAEMRGSDLTFKWRNYSSVRNFQCFQ